MGKNEISLIPIFGITQFRKRRIFRENIFLFFSYIIDIGKTETWEKMKFR